MLGQEETSGQEEGMAARPLVMRVEHVTLTRVYMHVQR